MKKMLKYIPILLIFLSASCDVLIEDDSYTTVTINEVPDHVSKIHIAVFNSEMTEDNLLVKNSFNPSNRVVMNIPSGPNRFFLVIAENSNGTVDYSGASSYPVKLKPGINVNLDIEMVEINTYLQGYFNQSPDVEAFVFNIDSEIEVPGAYGYELMESYYQTLTQKYDKYNKNAMNLDYISIERSSDSEIIHSPIMGHYYKGRIHFPVFNLFHETGVRYCARPDYLVTPGQIIVRVE